MRRNSCPTTACAPCRASTESIRTCFGATDMDLTVRYQPAESDSGLFGGNSNWRGPIWFPVNTCIIESLQKFHHYYGDDFKIECPTGSGQFMTSMRSPTSSPPADADLPRATRTAGGRCTRHYARAAERSALPRPPAVPRVLPRRHGRGVGASHQTGWTGLGGEARCSRAGSQ